MYSNPKLAAYKAFLNGKTASVIGVGISNIPLIDFLLENGVTVTARDKKDRAKLAENPKLDMARLEKAGVRFVTGENYLADIHEQIVFKSPGVRFDKPEILEAYHNGAFITSEMETFLVALSGKNSRHNRQQRQDHHHNACGKDARKRRSPRLLGGNIGKPLLSQIASVTPDDFAVLELSSFQLHTVNRFENNALPFAHIEFPDVGVLTNVSPNHLDWHTDMEEYAVAKRAVFTHMKPHGVFVTNRASDDYVRRFAAEAKAEGCTVRTFSAYDGATADGACIQNGSFTVNGKELFPLSEIRVPGLHNVENFMAAALAVWDYVTPDAILKTARTFTGVAHRLELGGRKGRRTLLQQLDRFIAVTHSGRTQLLRPGV